MATLGAHDKCQRHHDMLEFRSRAIPPAQQPAWRPVSFRFRLKGAGDLQPVVDAMVGSKELQLPSCVHGLTWQKGRHGFNPLDDARYSVDWT